jgi:hypothetical protein
MGSQGHPPKNVVLGSSSVRYPHEIGTMTPIIGTSSPRRHSPAPVAMPTLNTSNTANQEALFCRTDRRIEGNTQNVLHNGEWLPTQTPSIPRRTIRPGIDSNDIGLWSPQCQSPTRTKTTQVYHVTVDYPLSEDDLHNR